MKTIVRVNKCIVFGNATAIQSRDQAFKRVKLKLYLHVLFTQQIIKVKHYIA